MSIKQHAPASEINRGISKKIHTYNNSAASQKSMLLHYLRTVGLIKKLDKDS